jgi:RsiW-degrading membrane proteinase PrsW (M82 family)
MNKLTNLIKDYQLGTWCRRVAWIIVAVYIIQMAFQIYNVTRNYGLGATPFNTDIIPQVIGFAISYIPIMLFYFSILYVAGAVADHFAGLSEHETIEDEETKTLAR